MDATLDLVMPTHEDSCKQVDAEIQQRVDAYIQHLEQQAIREWQQRPPAPSIGDVVLWACRTLR